MTMSEPVGGQVQEQVVFGENRPGVRLSPALWVEAYGCRAVAEFQGLVTPSAVGTKNTLTFTVEEIGGSSGTIAIANMRRGSCGFSLNSGPYRQAVEFVYDAADTEATNPITVTM